MKLVKYSAVWCAPCKRYDPIIDAVAKEYQLPLERVDIEKEPEKAEGLLSVPVTRIFDDEGHIVAEKEGAMSTQALKTWLDDNMK